MLVAAFTPFQGGIDTTCRVLALQSQIVVSGGNAMLESQNQGRCYYSREVLAAGEIDGGIMSPRGITAARS